ncbi:MAG: nucleoside 2-deoxyribosyltransferase [Promethearchaeota archaeon]
MRIYLASALGFSSLLSAGPLKSVQDNLEALGYDVVEPFSYNAKLGAQIRVIEKTEKDVETLVKNLSRINVQIAMSNVRAIDSCDVVVALLDGPPDVDSGVAAEIGYASAKGKYIVALRTDFRPGGDNLGSKINLQVEYFIASSGGLIFSTVDELITCVHEHSMKK